MQEVGQSAAVAQQEGYGSRRARRATRADQRVPPHPSRGFLVDLLRSHFF